MKTDKRILMIVNEFPPVGESGVQRPLKFLKYLDRAGWDCFVVTPSKPSKTVLDRSLCKEVPKRARIYRTPSWGFGGSSVDRVAVIRQEASSGGLKAMLSRLLISLNHLIFPLDKQIGWVPFAFSYSLYIILRYRIRNVYITAFPFSAFIVGILLKKCLGNRVFWVADYRDAWQFEPLIETVLPSWRMAIIRRWDERVLRACDKAVFVTAAILDQYLGAYPRLKGKAVSITNGYDEDDFRDLTPIEHKSKALVYMGKIYSLNRSNILPLLDCLKKADCQIPLLHIGSLSHDAGAEISKGDFSFYDYQGYKPHREALAIAMGAAVNVLTLNDDKISEGVYTGKIFELLRLGKPILALGPKRGLVKELIESCGAGEYVWLQDSEAIIRALKRLLEQAGSYRVAEDTIIQYERAHLTERLAALYE